MSYTLKWTNPDLTSSSGGKEKADIVIPVASVNNTKTSINLTGKGAPNYGKALQESLMHILENFASDKAPPSPTVGQLWYDSKEQRLKACSSTVPTVTWKYTGHIQQTVNNTFPSTPVLGDIFLQDVGKLTCKLFIYTGVGRYPDTATTIGGWEQFYPAVEYIGGREEYDAVVNVLNTMIGPYSSKGNGISAKLVGNLTDFTSLDKSLVAAYTNLGPDANLIQPAGTETSASLLKVDPNSSDWDKLLTAVKYTLSRLDIPTNAVDGISDMPFVRDGNSFVASPFVSVIGGAPNNMDVAYLAPSASRRANRKMGSISMHQKYAETFNTLYNASLQRYSLRGVSGASGVYPSYWTKASKGTVVETSQGVQNVSLINQAPAVRTIDVRFANNDDMLSWMFSGGVLDYTILFTPTASDANSVNFKYLLDTMGTIRVTADATRIMTSVAVSKTVASITEKGMKDMTSTTAVQLATASARGMSYTVAGSKTSDTTFRFTVTFQGTGIVAGTMSCTTLTVADTVTNASGARVFGSPTSAG